MNYDKGLGEYSNWIFEDSNFDINTLGKTETIMALGNGYIGVRSSNEEDYIEQRRNTFISGTFNQSTHEEVTELPNLPDVIGVSFYISGKRFSLEQGTVSNYVKELNIKNGELTRSFTWLSPDEKEIEFKFKRFVSLYDKHLLASYIEMKTNDDIDLSFQSGINGQLTNSGAMHLNDGVKRIFDNKILSYDVKTTESNINIGINSSHNVFINNEVVNDKPRLQLDRKQLSVTYNLNLKKGDTLVIEKLSTYHTDRDIDFSDATVDLMEYALNHFEDVNSKRYSHHLEVSMNEWNRYWADVEIKVESTNGFDQLAIRFAQYHLRIMSPVHDERMGIGAKGLTGEGYKGHSFWDTEIFILPYYIYTKPEYAKQLLKYRYLGLNGARKKAKANSYEGAMYPWEAAWITDGEVTPVWGAVDIHTGKATKILSGFIEQHITADVVYALWLYFKVTGDKEFMEQFGYEMIFDTAIFWSSRFEWDELKQQFSINNVVGPDEYKEHVNNNAFTNYMAKFTIDLAFSYYSDLKTNDENLLNEIDRKINIHSRIDEMVKRAEQLYIPEPNEDGIVPQDDTYLSKEIIDLTKYKNQTKVGSMFDDYNLDEVNEIQVSKQADIMILFYLREELFSKETKRKNWNYYEPKTLHDSSLSLSTHSIIANDMHEAELSYELFRRATEIDLGPNMHTSDHGIHAASLGGLLQCIVNGYGGVRYVGDHLRIEPCLPKSWSSLEYPIVINGNRIVVRLTQETIQFTMDDNLSFCIELQGKMQEIKNNIILSI